MMERKEKTFPVLRILAQRQNLAVPESVPWALVAPHEAQARRNHEGQSLEELARRGGLSIQELYYVLQNRAMPPASEWISVGAAATFVTAQVKALEYTSPDPALLMAVVDAAYALASNLAEFEQLTDAVYLDMLTNALYDIGRWPQHVQVLREVER